MFQFQPNQSSAHDSNLQDFLRGFSIEVLPRTLAKIERLADLLPAGSRVYIAHIDGTPANDMVAAAKRVAEEGFAAMPHVPARLIKDRFELDTLLKRYAHEAGASQALVIAGGRNTPVGEYGSSMQLLETGLFDAHGFKRLHVAGHPEGSKDIDPDGGNRIADEALHWKQDFADRTDAAMALVTQFAFDANPVIEWAERLRAQGVHLPVHVGVAGPAKLQTLLKFALSCGIGPSVSVLQKRAKDVAKLLVPFEPGAVLAGLADHKRRTPHSLIECAHLFPLGGIKAAAAYATLQSGSHPHCD